MERKLYDSARKLLEDEISFAMGKDEKEVEELLHEKLEPFGESAVREIKHFVKDDDEDFDDELDGDERAKDDDDDGDDDSDDRDSRDDEDDFDDSDEEDLDD